MAVQNQQKLLRPPAIAGKFYPQNRTELINNLDGYLAVSTFPGNPNDFATERLKALIVPHAGYRYSGSIAASGYRRLSQISRKISRVVLVGPAHRVRINGIALSGADYFSTPLGAIPIDVQLSRMCVTKFSDVTIHNRAHQHEHSLETQLPFLQHILGKFSLLPVLVGGAEPQTVAQLLDFVWGGDETLILISSDLSHYKTYLDAQDIDEFTSSCIRILNPDPITYEHACGQVGVRALINVARSKKLKVEQIDVRNSGDTSDRKDQVVGYGCYGFYQPVPRISRSTRARLTRIAKESIHQGLRQGEPFNPVVEEDEELLKANGASFVTLKTKDGKLRGCIGSLYSDIPLAVNVAHNAFKSAFNDGRFAPVTVAEFASLGIEISVLTPAARIQGASESSIIKQLIPFVDGVIFKDGEKRGTFLPAVWNTIPDPQSLFRQLKVKAGFPEDYWSDSVQVFRYRTESW